MKCWQSKKNKKTNKSTLHFIPPLFIITKWLRAKASKSGRCVTFALSFSLTGIVHGPVYSLVAIGGSLCKGPLCHVNGESYNCRTMRTCFHSVTLSFHILSAKPDTQLQTQQGVSLLYAHTFTHAGKMLCIHIQLNVLHFVMHFVCN